MDKVHSAKQDVPYTVKEEIYNSVTHAIGLILGIVGLVLLLLRVDDADVLTITSMSIYGGSVIMLFLASTLYHAIPYRRAKRWLKTFDHCAIYLMIAGSFTPFLLVSLRTPLAIGLMIFLWVVAVVGIIFKVAFIYRFKRSSLITYLLMGWSSLIVIYELAVTLNVAGLTLLALGGVVYSLGVIFYVVRRIPYHHAIWHTFVLGGCICHFFAIYYYVAPF